jgi:hypothetical protein
MSLSKYEQTSEETDPLSLFQTNLTSWQQWPTFHHRDCSAWEVGDETDEETPHGGFGKNKAEKSGLSPEIGEEEIPKTQLVGLYKFYDNLDDYQKVQR